MTESSGETPEIWSDPLTGTTVVITDPVGRTYSVVDL